MTQPITAFPSKNLRGAIRVPGDKSISHRALMFGAIAEGTTLITGLLEGEDVLNTATALRHLGCRIERGNTGVWIVEGLGLGALQEPTQVLDMGNSGTSARLLLGLLATHGITSSMTGDASLVKRPMGRVVTPLEGFGAKFHTRDGKLPLCVTGNGAAKGITHRMTVASAQVKSAILLAGLNAEGVTEIVELEPTRDHSERMLRSFGATLEIDRGTIRLQGKPVLRGQAITVPGDPSSAAFLTVAGALCPGSRLTIENVGMNPGRIGLYQTLIEMGADLRFTNQREQGGEPVGDIEVTAGALRGVEVPASRAASMIDEYPVLAVAAAFAKGATRMNGLGELRVKESDRLARIAEGLAACGMSVQTGEDYLIVQGTGAAPKGGATVQTALDHRIAMAFLVMGLAAQNPVSIDDATPIATSFPGFVELVKIMGGEIS